MKEYGKPMCFDITVKNYSSIIVFITPLSYISYCSPLLFVVSLSAVSVTRFGQPRSENIEWKVPEINDS